MSAVTVEARSVSWWSESVMQRMQSSCLYFFPRSMMCGCARSWRGLDRRSQKILCGGRLLIVDWIWVTKIHSKKRYFPPLVRVFGRFDGLVSDRKHSNRPSYTAGPDCLLWRSID